MTAPKVTLEHLHSLIASEHFFSASDGVMGALPKGAPDEVVNAIPTDSLRLVTFCTLVLKNGFKVTGTSACVSKDNYNRESGEKYAREAAIDKLWELEGYVLRVKLHEAEVAPVSTGRPAYQQRVIDEKADLDDKLTKLRAFLETPVFASLPQPDRPWLEQQEACMAGYSSVLKERIARFDLEAQP